MQARGNFSLLKGGLVQGMAAVLRNHNNFWILSSAVVLAHTLEPK